VEKVGEGAVEALKIKKVNSGANPTTERCKNLQRHE
jgi:hypothetical protein